MKYKLSGLLILLVVIFYGCDEFSGDELPGTPEDEIIQGVANFETAPGSPLIINLFNATVFTTEEFSITIDKTTEKGKLEFMGQNLLKYTPPADEEYLDYFVYTASSSSQNDTDTVTIHVTNNPTDSACYPYANYDVYEINPLQEVANWVFEPLENDRLCGGDILDFKIYQEPPLGTAEAVEENDTWYIKYNPSFDFQSYDEMIYQVDVEVDIESDSANTSNGTQTLSLFGLISIYNSNSDTTNHDTCFYAYDDFVVLDSMETSVMINVLENDTLCGDGWPQLHILTPPIHGTAQVRNEADQNLIEYTVAPIMTDSMDYFEYKVCQSDICVTAWVYIDYVTGGNGGGGDDCDGIAITSDWITLVDSCDVVRSQDIFLNDVLCEIDSVMSVDLIQDGEHGTATVIMEGTNSAFVEYDPDCNFWDNVNPGDSTAMDEIVLKYLGTEAYVYVTKE